jgi:hypothetical protein
LAMDFHFVVEQFVVEHFINEFGGTSDSVR